MKKCCKCKIVKKFTDFYKDNKRKDKCQSMCKECDKNRPERKSDKHKAISRASVKKYMAKEVNKIKQRKREKIYRDNNKEIIAKIRAKYHSSKKYRDYLEKVKLIKNLRTLNWYHANRGSYKEKSPSYKLLQLFTIQNYECIYCNIDISDSRHIEHIVPMSKGGSNFITNIALSCPTCNLSKGAKDLNIWLKCIGKDYDEFMEYLNIRNETYFKDDVI